MQMMAAFHQTGGVKQIVNNQANQLVCGVSEGRLESLVRVKKVRIRSEHNGQVSRAIKQLAKLDLSSSGEGIK
jgi:hypothetical protein